MTDPRIAELVRRDPRRFERVLAVRQRELEVRALAEAAQANGNEKRTDDEWVAAERQRCRDDILYWWENYLYTYDPRRIGNRGADGKKLDVFVRFKPWKRQRELILWLRERIDRQEECLIEKSRDVGVSYIVCGVFLHYWLFEPGFQGTMASYKADLVDKRGSPDALFTKLRTMLLRLPRWMWPTGFNERLHDNAFQLTNARDDSTIKGDIGKQLGRGGRSLAYFADEAAHMDQSEDVEAGLSGNTECIIWGSTVSGASGLFYRKRHEVLPEERIFRFHFSDDPRKGPAWEAEKRSSMEPHRFAQEYDIDYHASIENVCIKADWIRAAQRIGELEPGLAPGGIGVLGLDVGAGRSRSVAITRFGSVVTSVSSSGRTDVAATAHWALGIARQHDCRTLNYDVVGVGSGVASVLNPEAGREVRDGDPECHPVNVGKPATKFRSWPDAQTSNEKFLNIRAEVYWMLRERLRSTWEHVRALEGYDDGRLHELDELLALPSGNPDAAALAQQLGLPRYTTTQLGKIQLESKDDMRKRGVRSPDHADALALTFYEDAARVFEWYVGGGGRQSFVSTGLSSPPRGISR